MCPVECLDMKRQLSTRKLAALLRERGWTERDLAYHADLSQPTVKAILVGSSGAHVATLAKIADALQVEDMNVLFDRLS